MAANTRDATAYAGFAGSKPMYREGIAFSGAVYFHVDMAAVKSYLGVAIDGSNGDVVQLWDIPALTHIHSCAIKLVKAEGAAATVAIGLGAGDARFLAAFNINGTVGSVAQTIVTDAAGLTFGQTFPATDTLDLIFGTDTDVAVAEFDIAVLCTQIVFPDRTVLAPTTWH